MNNDYCSDCNAPMVWCVCGDDGTGHCDYVDVVCDFCGQSYEMEQENESYV